MKPTINEFESHVEGSMTADLVTWFGYYEGRFYYEGIAVEAEEDSDVVDMLINFNKGRKESLGSWDHKDNMGTDYIYAWRLDNFREEEEEVA